MGTASASADPLSAPCQVQLMEQGTRYGSIARHASEKALWGYCSLHHLLLALAETYPELKALAACMVKDFVAAPENRTKVPETCVDENRFMALVTICVKQNFNTAPTMHTDLIVNDVRSFSPCVFEISSVASNIRSTGSAVLSARTGGLPGPRWGEPAGGSEVCC